MSSGCVFRNLFTCEKKCDSVASRKALLQEFTSKAYQAEVVYVDNDGKTTEEEYTILFRLSENQKDSEMIRVHGNAFLHFGEDTPIKVSWSGIYLAKKNGYKMRLSGDNIEKDFYLYCDGNETINFLIKKTASELGRGMKMMPILWGKTGHGELIPPKQDPQQLECSRCIGTVAKYCRNQNKISYSKCLFNSPYDINSKCSCPQKYPTNDYD